MNKYTNGKLIYREREKIRAWKINFIRTPRICRSSEEKKKVKELREPMVQESSMKCSISKMEREKRMKDELVKES